MKKQKLVKRTALLFVAVLLLSSAAEKAILIDPFIEKIQEQITRFSNHYQEEKVYLQMDRNFYQPNDPIWFSGWIRNADHLKADHVSEMLYVELINPKGSLIERQNLVANEGNVNGAFQLPQEIGGIYKIKAYTQWQKNTNAFFEKDIQVQSVVFPNLIMKLDFERKAYGPGSTVTAKLEAKDLEDEVLRLREYSYIISINGKKYKKGKSTLDFDGKADLVFDLPTELKSSDGLLQILIPHKGQTESISRAVPITLNDIDLQFFPEGGSMVAGLSSKVAFKALNEFGKPADVEGVILNKKGEEVAQFNSHHMGMGATKIWPERGNEYTAKITKPEGITKVYKLPEVELRGLQLAVIGNETDHLDVAIQSTRSQEFHLIAQSGDKVLFSETAVAKKLSKLSIPTTDFPMGITRLTLFDRHQNIAAERLVFINPHKQLEIDISTDKKQYSPREKVKMEISVKDFNGNPVAGNFALSVADEKLLAFADDKQGHILSKLFLESELKGKIEEPDFYFDKEEEKAIAALDHLMLTQGWRRYDWKEVRGEELMALNETKERCDLAGVIVDGNNCPIANARVSILDSELETVTDSEGIFAMPDLTLGNYGVIMKVKAAGFQTLRKSIVKYKSNFKIVMADPVGTVGGLVLHGKGKAAIGAKVTLANDEGSSWSVNTDRRGEYIFHQLKPGAYSLSFKWNNLPTYQIEKVMIWPSENLRISRRLLTKEEAPNGIIEKGKSKSEERTNDIVIIEKQERAVREEIAAYEEIVRSGRSASLDEIVVVEYKVPLVEQDNTTQGAIVTSEDIQKFATKSIASLAAATAGMSQVDEGDPLRVRGSRSNAIDVYVDGIRVSASQVNEVDIAQLQIITGGIPAAFGGGDSFVPERRWVGVDKNKKREAIYHFRETSEDIGSDLGFVGLNGSSGYRRVYSSSRAGVKRPSNLYALVDQPARLKVKECNRQKTETDCYTCANKTLEELVHDVISEGNIAYNNGRDYSIEFFINKKGELGGLKVQNSYNNYYIQKQLKKSFKKYNRWKPAVINGRKVASKIVIPVASEKLARKQRTNFSKSPVFYAPQYHVQESITKRTDFRSTIYWNPNLQTDETGKATVEFWNSDDLTTFEARIEGLSNNGLTGEGVHTYSVQKPFSMTAKMPVILLEGDEVRIPITLSNNTEEALEGELRMQIPSCFKATEQQQANYQLAAKESKTIYPVFKVVNQSETKQIKRAQIEFSFKAGHQQDVFSQLIRFQSDGYPISEILTGTEYNNTFTLNINKLRKGTIKAELKAHTSIVSEIMATAERMLRQPYGCFEQTSSCNYPNLLVMQYLKEHAHRPNPAVMKKAEDMLDFGYKRLMGYEVKGGGFDWFGRGPANAGITAYGILQFTDMKSVYPVEQKMLDRTVEWLMGRRDGKGGWKENKRKFRSWSATPEIRNAYINWALAEAGHAKKIQKEITKSYNNALHSDDPYILSLVVNTLLAADDSRANKLLSKLKKHQNKDGSFDGKSNTMVNSRGKVMALETTALATLALLNSETTNSKEASKAILFISKSKSKYGFGSTQSTVFCIKALLKFTEQSVSEANEGMMALLINDQLIEEVSYSTKNNKEIGFKDFSHHLQEGEQKLSVRFSEDGDPIPFDLQVDYSSTLPTSSEEKCKLNFTTKLSDKVIPQGETTRLTTRLSNTNKEIVTSPIAIIGIPAGLSPQPWQLKKLQEEEVIAYYEVMDNKVVFYLRELAPGTSKDIHLDLKADVPGKYLGPASQAYLYYENDVVNWVAPAEVVVVD